MSWSEFFLDALQAPVVRPVYAVETFASALSESLTPAGTIYSSHPLGEGDLPALDAQSIQLGNHSVTPQEWTYNAGAWRFALSSTDPATIAQSLRRGTWVKLMMGFAGWYYHGFQTVAIGRVQSVTFRRGVYEVEVWDLINALRTRFSSVPAYVQPFYGRVATTLGASYALADTTITLTSTAGWAVTRSGGYGAIRITPGVGDPFVLTFTGVAGATLTGVSVGGQFGTTAYAASAGVAVEDLAYLDGHPLDSVIRWLVGTGAATNGSDDVTTQEAGMAVPAEFVDVSGIKQWRDSLLVPSSGSWAYDLLVPEPLDDGLSWIADWFGDIGCWLCVRQGQITVRAAHDPQGSPVHSGLTILASDVDFSDASVALFDPDSPAESVSVSIVTTNGATTTATAVTTTLPASWGDTVDLTGAVNSNETAIRSEISGRIRPWLFNIAERLTMRLRGGYWSQLCPGDVVTLSMSSGVLAYLSGARAPIRGGLQSTVDGYIDREAMVLGVTSGLITGTTIVDFGVLPLDSSDSWGS